MRKRIVFWTNFLIDLTFKDYNSMIRFLSLLPSRARLINHLFLVPRKTEGCNFRWWSIIEKKHTCVLSDRQKNWWSKQGKKGWLASKGVKNCARCSLLFGADFKEVSRKKCCTDCIRNICKSTKDVSTFVHYRKLNCWRQ